MSATAGQRFSPRQTGWIALVVFGAWIGFLFLPSQSVPVPASSDLTPVRAQSKLEAAGLRDNVDWTGLPDLFSVWVDRVPWDHGKTIFAYWHPGSRRYAYLFEARQTREGIRFRALVGAEARAYEHLVPETIADGEQADTHPFLFIFERPGVDTLALPPLKPPSLANPGVPPAVPIDLKAAPLEPTSAPIPKVDVH